jgi:hypothetical protein
MVAGHQKGNAVRKNLIFGVPVLLILLGSFLPEGIKENMGTQGQWHRTVHIGSFAVLAAAARYRFRDRAWFSLGLALMAASILLEFVQARVFRQNYFEWWDVRDDGIGILIGMASAAIILRDGMRKYRWFRIR